MLQEPDGRSGAEPVCQEQGQVSDAQQFSISGRGCSMTALHTAHALMQLPVTPWSPRLTLVLSSMGICFFPSSMLGTVGCMHASVPSCVQLFATWWAVAHQVPLSMGFSRQEHWSGLPCLLQGIFPTQGLNYISCVSCIADRFFAIDPLGNKVQFLPLSIL